uniref:CCHC-type domain-containing protein n=1 Tax=Tanacetum cinerariifolium TaxID=118510 RepID=A0A6L2JFY0_TANCI|nr:hypothetical protein [Tanacetum cinerariifolium]
MVKRFEMSMIGEMKFFLGLQVNQFSNVIFINQSKYILDILKRFGLENCDTVPTPMVEQAKLKLDLVGKPDDHMDDRSMIGSLMYVTSSKPDIMFGTCMCAKYHANPNEHHVSAIRRIFRYLKGTINLGLWYPKDFGFDLTAYSDADHAGCHLDRKSSSGSVQFLGDKLESLLGLILYRTPWPIKVVLRIQQYLQNEHYALWEVIEFGDSYKAPPEETGKGPASESSARKKGKTVAITTKDIQKRRNYVKERTTLLLALPDEHQLRFSKYETAKELWEAILKTFGGNEATKKTKKNQLKLQYGNFKAKGLETLEQTFNRLQAIVSHLEFMDVELKQDDLNQNGKGKVHTASVSTASTQVSIASTDVAAASLSHDTICVYIATQSNGFKIKYEDITQIDEDDIEEMDIKWSMSLLSMRPDRFWKKTGKKITIQGSDVDGFDKSKVECFNCHKIGHFAKECRAPRNQDRGKRESYKQGPKEEEPAPKALMAIDGIRWDWSYMANEEENHALVADDEVPTEFNLMAKSSSSSYNEVYDDYYYSKSCRKNTKNLNTKISKLNEELSDCDTDLYNYKRGLSQVKARLVEFKENEVTYRERIRVLERDVEIRDNKIEYLKNELEQIKKEKESLDNNLTGFENASKDLDNLLGSLPEFVDDTVIDYRRPTPNIGASKCNKSELQSSNFSVFEHGESTGSIMSKPMIKFVKEADCPRVIKINNTENTRKSTMKYDEMYRNISKDFKLNDDTNVLLRTPRQHNMYSIDLNNIIPHKNLTCLVTKALVDESMLWHRRLGHLNFKTMNKLVRNNLVKGLPSKCFENDHTCVAYLKGKQHKAYCKTKLVNFVSKPFHTLHMDLFGPTSVSSLNHKSYCLVVTDDFSRVLVNKSQNKTPYELFNSRIPAIGFLRPFRCHVMILNTLDHLGKLDAKGDEGYFVEYSLSSKSFRVFNKRTKKAAENLHVDFLENKLIEKEAGPNWLFDIDTLTNSINYVPVVVAGISSTNISCTKDAASQAVKKDVSSLRYIALPNWFHEAHMKTSNDTIRNSDAQDDSQKEQDYNADVLESSGISNPTATSKVPSADQVEPTVSLTVESKILTVSSPVPTVCLDISPESSSGPRLISEGVFRQKEAPSLGNALTLSNRFEDTFGDTTNAATLNEVEADLSNMETSIPEEPKKIFDALKDPKVRPIGTKWVLKNKKDERGIVIRNNAMLVAQGYTQEEGIDYEEVFAPVAKTEAIRIFLAYALFMGFIVYQMDVKSAFLYGTINDEVYVMQPPGFQNPKFPKRVYKVEKAMYGLHQAPRAWYGEFLLVQVYVDDIIFGSSNPLLCREFEALMHDKFQMSDMGELTFFLGLQVLQKKDGIFLLQDKYVGDILKKFGYSDIRIETTEQETKIIATVDGKPRTISESSLRRHLKLNDEEWISSLPDAELFENLLLMGYNILPSQRTVPLFASMIVTQGEGLANPTEPHHTTSPQEHQSPQSAYSPQHDSLPLSHQTIIPEPISHDLQAPTETLTPRRLTKRAIWIAQSKALSPDTSAMSYESSPRVPSLDADEGSMQQRLHELMDLCTSLQRQHSQMADKIKDLDIEISRLKARVKSLEDKERRRKEPIQEDALITWGIIEIWEELGVDKSTEKGSNDTEEMVNVLSSMEATNILSSGDTTPADVFPIAGVPTVSGSFPTVHVIFTTASVVTPYTRRSKGITIRSLQPIRIPMISAKDKGKEKVTETEVPKKKKLQEQIDAQVAREMEEEIARENQRLSEQVARDSKIARIHAEEELKLMIKGLDRSNEVIAKHLKKIELISELVKYQDHLAEILKGMTLEQIKEKFIPVWKHMQDFVPMSSKEESEKVKRPGIKLDQRSSKRVKISHTSRSEPSQEQQFKGSKGVYEEELKGIMQLVPLEEVYIEALQQFDREDLHQLSILVKETFSIKQSTRDKEKELWVELKRLFKPDSEDKLWTYDQAFMHDPLD